ncbi:MAG: hypothetical protein ACR2F8_11015 [Caulobacteraceae bacterium]
MKAIHWINTTGGDFSDGADWSGGAVPAAGDKAVIDASGTYTVTMSSSETVGSLTLNDRGAAVSLGSGATLTVESSLTLEAGRFDLGSGAAISGGMLRAGKGKFLWQGGALDGVTYNGPLNLRHRHSVLSILTNGLVLRGSDGTGVGVANLSRDALLDFVGIQTFDNAIVNLNGSNIASGLPGSGAVLTLGAEISINHMGGLSVVGGDTIFNEGAINANSTTVGGGLLINSTKFTNQGSITISNRDKLDLSPSIFTNLASGTLTSGSYEIDAGSTLELAKDQTVVTDDAVIVLSGAGSAFQSRNDSSQEVSIESTLTTIGAAGTLKLLVGRDWTSTNMITNDGALVLGGGRFAPGGLTNDGVISGHGVISVAVADTGTIKAVGGTLDLIGAISGNGALQVNAGAALKVEAAAAASLTTTFNGVGGNLKLGDAADFAATIAGFAADDTIDVLGQAATSATLQSGDKLAVMNGSQTVATLQLSGDYAGAAFAVASDGHGGSNVTVSQGAARFAQALASLAPPTAAIDSPVSDAWPPHAPTMLAGPRTMAA